MCAATLIDSFNEAQSKLVIQTADLPLGTLAEMVKTTAIDLQPGFQRRERWNLDKQSALIESFLLNVPVPPIYLSEENNGTYTAIDGKQRLKAISDFMNGKFKLQNLDRLSGAEGKTFKDMPTEISNALNLRPFLRVVTLLKQSDSMLKYEVFLRLNRGGESLNAQEIRNVAFRGALNDKIYELSESDFLRDRLKIESDRSAAYRLMNDAEYVLRFMALNDGLENFSGSLVREMDDFMRRKQNAEAQEVDQLAAKFQRALSRCEEIWGHRAFRRPDAAGWRDQTLAGMYDAQMLSVVRISDQSYQDILASRDSLIQGTRDLFDNEEFDKAVRTGTNTPNRIKFRVQMMKELLENV